MGSVDVSKIQKRPAPKSGNLSDSSLSHWLQKDFSLTGKRLGVKKKEAFFLELSILLGAGLDLKSILDLLVADQRKPSDLALFESIRHAVVQGKALSEALNASEQFTLYEQCSIQIGEEIGKLPVILKELADYHQKKSRQKRQIVQALTYPGLVLGTSVASVTFMMHFIVPMFADVFKRFGGKLPWITQLILDSSEAFSSYFWVWFGGMLLMGALCWQNRKKVWFRENGARVVLATPLIGEIVRKIYLARFCQSMTLLISSRIPLLRATVLVRQMIGFYLIEKALSQVEQDILQGEFLHRSLVKFPVFPNRMLSLIKVGEEVNQLDVFFGKIAGQYTEEVEHQTALIGSLLEPLMIVFLGFIVGFILIAMYLPLFQLSATF